MGNPIKNLKVFHKQLIIIIAITITMLILGILTTIGLAAQKILLSRLIDSRFYFIEQSTIILEYVLTCDNDIAFFITQFDKVPDTVEADNLTIKVKDGIDINIDLIDKNLKNEFILPEERKYFSNILNELNIYKQACIELIATGKLNSSTLDSFITQIRKTSRNIKQIVSDFRNYEKAIVTSSKENGGKQLDNQIIVSWIVCVIAILIPLFLSIIISRSIVAPINDLVRYTQLVVENDLTKQCIIDSRNELEKLSSNINVMASNIREIINSIKVIQGRNMGIKDTLVTSIQEIFAALVEISANLNSTVSMLSNLNERVNFSIKTSKKTKEILGDFKRLINDQISSVKTSSAYIEKIVEAMKDSFLLVDKHSTKSIELLKIIDRGDVKMLELNKKVKEISVITNDILSAIEVIKNIADQTNSINSAIQAAQVDNTGKGVAIIANQIDKLAKYSTDGSLIISQNLGEKIEMIKNLPAISNEASTCFQTAYEEVKFSVNALKEITTSMQSLSLSGQDISTAMSTLQDIAYNIADYFSETETRIVQIKDTMYKVSDVTSEVINAITQINISSEQINTAMSMLSKNSIAMEDGIMDVTRSLNKFKTE